MIKTIAMWKGEVKKQVVLIGEVCGVSFYQLRTKMDLYNDVYTDYGTKNGHLYIICSKRDLMDQSNHIAQQIIENTKIEKIREKLLEFNQDSNPYDFSVFKCFFEGKELEEFMVKYENALKEWNLKIDRELREKRIQEEIKKIEKQKQEEIDKKRIIQAFVDGEWISGESIVNICPRNIIPNRTLGAIKKYIISVELKNGEWDIWGKINKNTFKSIHTSISNLREYWKEELQPKEPEISDEELDHLFGKTLDRNSQSWYTGFVERGLPQKI